MYFHSKIHLVHWMNGIFRRIWKSSKKCPWLSYRLPKAHDLNIDSLIDSFHWNLNSKLTHNFAKLSLLRASVSEHKFDIICLSETYFNYSIDGESLEISWYYLVRFDHPSNNKHCGICIYYKNFFPLKVTDFCLLKECIAFDLIIINKLCSFVALYRSSSHSQKRQFCNIFW